MIKLKLKKVKSVEPKDSLFITTGVTTQIAINAALLINKQPNQNAVFYI